MIALREPHATDCRRSAIKLDPAIGEDEWKQAARDYEHARHYLSHLGQGEADASERVTPLRPFRKGSARALEAHARSIEDLRRAAIRVLCAPAPSPRELANKIKLLALIEGLPDPAGSYVGPAERERANSSGYLPLRDVLGQLLTDAMILDQFHDASAHRKAVKQWKPSKRARGAQ